jgi:hypothetical protein
MSDPPHPNGAPTSRPELVIALDLSAYAAMMSRAVDGHVAAMKTALRAIEDGSYLERASMKRPDAVIHFSTSDREQALDGAAQRAVRTGFRSMMTELVAFLDSVVALRRL